MPDKPVRVLLVIPPLTQLNTPYPSTATLAGFLRQRGVVVDQIDLGIELIDRIFCHDGVKKVFEEVDRIGVLPEDWDSVCDQRERYAATVDAAVRFLRGDDPTLATRIAGRRFLPEGPRFDDADELEWAFGDVGTHDAARYLATRFLDDLADVIRFGVNPHFSFTRYAESLSVAAESYEPLADALRTEPDWLDATMLELLEERVASFAPTLVGFSVPFPGNLYGALRCGAYLGTAHPDLIRVLGGGYATTELRSLREPRLFDAVDFVVLDDGEAPLDRLIRRSVGEDVELSRTFERVDGTVRYHDAACVDVAHTDKPAPDYDGLSLDKYISVLQVPNAMHRLWSDGRWNKLTLAHGCYWGKCSFCDVTLDYIGRYDPSEASRIVDQMETVAAQTGETGFHFVDEAAPPSLLRDVAREIISRGGVYSWWTNIRFEKTFDRDLCELLAASGCIAVSGGLEVASDRLLSMMQKGVTVEQVARVAGAFATAGVRVHAYLMYGFPTQTPAETVDALEVVRQLFAARILSSGFWHRFAMTAHAPIGLEPQRFGVTRRTSGESDFANNDLEHEDPHLGDIDELGCGLTAALNEYVRGRRLDRPVYEWFEVPVGPPTVAPTRIADALAVPERADTRRLASACVWLGSEPDWLADEETQHIAGVAVMGVGEYHLLELPESLARVVASMLSDARPAARVLVRLGEAFESIERSAVAEFLESDGWRALRADGLLLV